MNKKKIAEAMAAVLERHGWEVRDSDQICCTGCDCSIGFWDNYCKECGKRQPDSSDEIPILIKPLIEAYKAGKKVDKWKCPVISPAGL